MKELLKGLLAPRRIDGDLPDVPVMNRKEGRVGVPGIIKAANARKDGGGKGQPWLGENKEDT